jgi:hypothetical protein
MEKIISIKEATFKTPNKDWCQFDGYQVVTSSQTIQFGIDNGQSCCESWGHMITNDNADEFIGATVTGISITDTVLNNKKIGELEFLDAGGVMFVNIETDKGLLQFVAYNAHNGYYGHESVIISKQLNHSETL